MGISEYDPIWAQLKASETTPKKVAISANRLLHPRILKAVKKRKNLDIGYKLEVDPKIPVLSHISENSKLTFYLLLLPSAKDLENL
jgi:hypothetical protein